VPPDKESKQENAYWRVLATQERLLGPEHPKIATLLNNLGDFYESRDRFTEAKPCFERALAIFEKHLGAAHPKVTLALVNYAHVLKNQAVVLERRAKAIVDDFQATSVNTDNRRPKIDTRMAKFRLAVRPSRIHRWGVYAAEVIPAGKEVIEYTGKRISSRESKRRSGRRQHYVFLLNRVWRLDGAVNGSGAQYINHSCDPNVVARNLGSRIFCFSSRRIRPGEELLLDYKFSKDAPRVVCHCGSAKCRGTINVK
jgi:uncharacterized protein